MIEALCYKPKCCGFDSLGTLGFFSCPNPSSCNMALGSTQPLREISTRNLPGSKKRPARKVDNLDATYEPIVWKCGSLNLSQPQGPPWPFIHTHVYIHVNSILFALLLKLILWCNQPMRELIIFRNLEEHDCAKVVERCRVLPSLPSPCFAPHRALLGYTVNTGSRNSKEGPRDLHDVTRNNTQRCILLMSDSSVYKRHWRQCSSVEYESVFMRVQVSCNREFKAVRNQFAVSYRRELWRVLLWSENLRGIFGV
jgi:hypothetical protein